MAASTNRAGLASHFDLDVDLRNRVLTPYGDVDICTSSILRAAAAAFIAQAPGDLTIDLANIVFVDSALLAVLIEVQARVRDQGGQLRLVNQPATVLRLVRAAGIKQMLS